MITKQEIKRIERKIEYLQSRLKRLKEEKAKEKEEYLDKIDDFPIKGTRYTNMYLAGIKTVNDLINSSEDEILAIPSLGKVSLEKIINWMEKYDFNFVDD